jgi:uncharacterized protein
VTPDAQARADAVPRWVADEMLGRLARYLRFLGHDTVYARGFEDDEIRELAVREGRVLLTRDRELAGRADQALLLRSVDVLGQLREVRTAFPSVPSTVTFDRCPECNTPLRRWNPPADREAWPIGVPHDIPASQTAVWECPACLRHFWEGSHAPRIRDRVAEAWSYEATP